MNVSALFDIAKVGWGAVSGVDEFADAIGGLVVRMVLRSSDIDASAADDIVSRARAAVPQDTGRLFSGITARLDDTSWIVQASAIAPRGRYTMDYAFLVEHGTQAGERGGRRGGTVNQTIGGRSRAGAYNATTGRRYRVANANRLSDRTHPGTKPQPYFYPSIDAVMGERFQRHQDSLPSDW